MGVVIPILNQYVNMYFPSKFAKVNFEIKFFLQTSPKDSHINNEFKINGLFQLPINFYQSFFSQKTVGSGKMMISEKSVAGQGGRMRRFQNAML